MGKYLELAKALKNSGMSIRQMKRDAGFSAGGIASMIIIILVLILIAVAIIPTIFTSVSSATSNSTLTANPHYSAAFSLVYLIPLVFVAGILVLVVVLMFEHLKE